MKQRVNLQEQSTDKLISLFREHASERGRAFQKNSIQLANRHFDVAKDVYQELKNRGPDHLTRFAIHLDDPDAYVRKIAASTLLELMPARCTPVFEALLTHPDASISMESEWALKGLKKIESSKSDRAPSELLPGLAPSLEFSPPCPGDAPALGDSK
jgi:hypothetical protein